MDIKFLFQRTVRLLAIAMLFTTFITGHVSAAQGTQNGKIAYVLTTYADDGTASEMHTYLMNPDGSDQKRLTQDSAFTSDAGISFSPAGNQIVVTGWKSATEAPDLYIINTDDGGMEMLPQTTDGRDALWSPDGNYIVFHRLLKKSDNPGLYLYNIASKTVTSLISLKLDETVPVDWFSDSQTILYGRQSRARKSLDLFQIGLNGGEPQKVPLRNVEALRFSPDGKQIVANMSDQMVLLNALTEAPNVIPCLTDDNLCAAVLSTVELAWSPDSAYIVYADNDQVVRLGQDPKGERKSGLKILDLQTNKVTSIDLGTYRDGEDSKTFGTVVSGVGWSSANTTN